MRHRFIAGGVALAGLVVLSSAAFAQPLNQARSAQQPIPCVNEWKLPNGCDMARVLPKTVNPKDLSGVWSRSKGAGNMNDAVELTEEGKKRLALNKPSYGPRAVIPALGNDPMGTCDPLGLTRNLFLEVGGRSLEFVHLPDRILQFFEWQHQYRTIWMDGRKHPTEAPPRWMGYSIGRWEGDTLVVETINMDERTWLDMWGQPHTEEARFEERYRRTSPTTLEYSMRITDPVLHAKPFVSDMKQLSLHHEKGMDEKLETFCVPTEEQRFNETIRNPAGGVTTPTK
jgi:hypothetical protein